jgi:hypothetical protein
MAYGITIKTNKLPVANVNTFATKAQAQKYGVTMLASLTRLKIDPEATFEVVAVNRPVDCAFTNGRLVHLHNAF